MTRNTLKRVVVCYQFDFLPRHAHGYAACTAVGRGMAFELERAHDAGIRLYQPQPRLTRFERRCRIAAAFVRSR